MTANGKASICFCMSRQLSLSEQGLLTMHGGWDMVANGQQFME
jgi:hypothetical protein